MTGDVGHAVVVVDALHVAGPSTVARFWRGVAKSDGCWLWSGTRRNGKHGSLSNLNEPVYVHRLSWAIHYGPIPMGGCICHTCDVGRCVRPDHLFLGTQADNVADMWAKGRAVPPPVHLGLNNAKATLGDEQVREIRRRHAASPGGQRALAAEFGVSQSTIWRLVHNLTRIEAGPADILMTGGAR